MKTREDVRPEFEEIAEAMGFDLTRCENVSMAGEPWGEYEARDTGFYWGGYLLALKIE